MNVRTFGFLPAAGWILAIACLGMGVCHSSAANAESAAVERAKKKAAAERGDAGAQFEMGMDLHYGDGVQKNYAEAARWFARAAAQGHPQAKYRLGKCYSLGEGVPKNDREAAKWFLAAAQDGDEQGQASIGVMFEDGKVVAKNEIEALKWFLLAASRGEEEGITHREALLKRMRPQDVAEARKRATDFTAKASRKADSSGGPKASGSCFFITSDGFLVTNHHVVEDATKLVVVTKQGNFPAKVIKTDKTNDIAVIKVAGVFRPVPLATTRAVKLGESVFTIGFPNVQVQGIEPKLTKGEINSLAGIQDDPRYFQTSVAAQPGNSGGPLLDMYGNVVGMVTMRLDDIKTWKLTGSLPQNVNYAVKSSAIAAFLQAVPGLMRSLKQPNPPRERKFEDVVRETQEAAALVLVY